MEKSQMPTADEILTSYIKEEKFQPSYSYQYLITKAMEEYAIIKAKYYVTKALESAAEKAELERDYLDWQINKKSILNSYNLDNIK